MSKKRPEYPGNTSYHPANRIAPERQGLARARAAGGRAVFDKRAKSQADELSFRRARLEILAVELSLLFAYKIEAAEPFCTFSDEAEPTLILGRTLELSLSVEIEPVQGLYVLYDTGPTGCTVVTASEERLVDHVVSLVACVTGELTPRTADTAVDVLIGRSLEDVERRLVLRTLLHFNGDRRQTAFALGLDEGALRARLRRYLLAELRTQASPEELQ